MLLHVFISLFERLIKFIAKPEYFFCHQNGFNNNNINFKNFHLGAIMATAYKNLIMEKGLCSYRFWRRSENWELSLKQTGRQQDRCMMANQ